MSLLRGYAMKKLIESQLNGGEVGLRKHEADFRELLSDFSNEHLDLYIELLKVTTQIAKAEHKKRNKLK